MRDEKETSLTRAEVDSTKTELESTGGDVERRRAQTKGTSYSSLIPHPSSLPSTPSSLRILLWDIDGTLIRSVRAGAFKDYTIPMLEEVFGTAGQLPQMKVSGMTDLQIVGEALKHEGFTHADIRERI